MLLKRHTWQNIVWGGAAGAVPPLVGWAAVEGSLSGLAIFMFAIVFFWTPPHFWALSLLMKDEYAKVGVPMLPVVRGEDETRRQILLYTVLLYAVTQLPFCAGGLGTIYLVASLGLGLAFIGPVLAAAAPRRPPRRAACLPLLAGLPGGSVRRYGGRRPALTDQDPGHGSQPRQEEHPHRADRDRRRSSSCSGSRSSPPRSTSHEPGRTARPPAGEEIHLPGPSAKPAVLALGSTIALLGITWSWIVVADRRLRDLCCTVVSWIGDTRRDIDELPSSH